MDQLDCVGQKLIYAVSKNGVGLPAANLHDRPVASGFSPDLVKKLSGKLRITIFVYIFHGNRSQLEANSEWIMAVILTQDCLTVIIVMHGMFA